VCACRFSPDVIAVRPRWIVQSELVHGRQIPVEETLANLDAVTTEDIQTLAREFFVTEKIAFAAIGDLSDLKVERSRLAI